MISALKNSYSRIIDWGTGIQSFLLLVIRLYWGYSFLIAGTTKLQNIETVSTAFEGMGIPFASFTAPLVAYIEAIGGFCLLVGFASRLAATPLIVIMIVAMLTAHFDAVLVAWEDSQKLINQGAMQHLFASLIIFAFGPGIFSIDYLLGRMTGKSGR